MATTVFDLVATLSLDSSKYESGLNKAKGIAGGFGSALGTAAKVGLAAVTAATGAVVGFGTASVKTGETFDKSMSQVAATMGLTMQDMEKETGKATLTFNGATQEWSGNLREFAQVMGANTAFSASQAADALNYMALAGYKTQESIDMLPNVLNLAAAGNIDLARASDMVTDAQTAFGIEAPRVTQMVDEMAKASSTGNTSVEQLGDAFLVVGGLAQELNGGMVTLKDGTTKSVDGIQELEIALTAMANAGVKGSEAGTHMRNMLLKLSSPTDAGAKQMEALGVKVFDADGKMRSLKDIMGDLSGALGDLTQEQKIQAISDLFNTRDLASAEALLNAVGQDWNAIGESILDSQGAAQKMADTQLDNLAGDITLFKSALEGAKIAVSDTLTPALRDFVQFATSGLTKVTEAFQKDGFKGAMDAFGEVLSEGLTMIVKKIPDMIDAGLTLLEALGEGIMQNMPVIIDAASEIVDVLFEHLKANAGGLMPAAIEFITSILKGIEESADDIVNIAFTFVSMLLDSIATTIEELYPQLVETMDALLEAINGFFSNEENIKRFEETVVVFFEAIGKALGKSLPTLIKIFAVDFPQAMFNGLMMGLLGLLDGLIAFIIGLFEGIIEAIKETLGIHSPSTVFEEIGAMMMQGLWDGIALLVGTVTEGITNFIATIVEIFTNFVSTFSENFALFIDGIVLTITSTAELIKTGIVDFISFITDAVVAFWEDIKAKASEFATNVGRRISELRTNFVKEITDLKTNATRIWTDFTSAVSKIITTFATNVKKWVGDVKTNFVSGIKDLVKDALDTFKDFWDEIKSSFEEFVGSATEWGQDLMQNFLSGVRSKIDEVRSAIEELASAVAELIAFSEPDKGPLSNFHTYAPDMMDLFAKGIRDNTDVVTDQIKKSFDFGGLISSTAVSGVAPSERSENKGIIQNVTINSPVALDPSEIARQTRNANRQLALQMRLA